MYSKHHLVVSAAVGAALLAVAPMAPPAWLPPVGVVGYAAAIGVVIDLDHFVLAWLNSGTPRAIRAGLARPRTLVIEQSVLFEAGEVSKLDRLLSHVVIVGVAVPATWALAPFLGLVTAVVLYTHVLADLVWDVVRVHRGIDQVS